MPNAFDRPHFLLLQLLLIVAAFSTTALVLNNGGPQKILHLDNARDECKNSTYYNPSPHDIDHCATLAGDLIFNASDATSITLNKLTHLGGSLLIITNANMTSVSFPKLHHVDGYVRMDYNPALKHVSMPDLTIVHAYLEFVDNPLQHHIRLPSLNTLITEIFVSQMASLTMIDLPKLANIGFDPLYDSIEIDFNAALTLISMPQLTTVNGTILIQNNNASLVLSDEIPLAGHGHSCCIVQFPAGNDACTDYTPCP